MAPFHTYSRMIEATENEEKEWVNREIGERRTRLGAKVEIVNLEVRREAYSRFHLEDLYAQAIDWTTDDEVRRTFEEKAFQRAYDTLAVLPPSAKSEKRDHVLNLANGMVIIKHAFVLAWKVALEWVDAESLAEWNVNIFRDFIEFFPDEGLSKVLKGFLGSEISPFPKELSPNSTSGEDAEINAQTRQADQLILMVEGLEDCRDSLLAHRILTELYLSLDEFGSAVETGRAAQDLCRKFKSSFAMELQDSTDAVNISLASALIIYQSPRHHPEAKSLFQDILTRKPTSTKALLGVGLILEEDEDFAEAIGFLTKASERGPENIKVKTELAWCKAQAHDLEGGLQDLKDTLAQVEAIRPIDLVIKSEVLYRIGYCLWELDASPAARKNKEGAYRYFVDSIKANPEYAPAYTKLGIYFEDYSRSKKRARSAFQKAFELSISELEAAQRLARVFAEGGEWDLVELVAQRVVDSGKARPAPGSKKQPYSWPYAALGTVQLNNQQYAKSIVSFQQALRISPSDYHSWVGLGESYHNAGRYTAATRAFEKAESLDNQPPPEQTWFAKYMLANVCREMGLFDEAVRGYDKVLAMKPGEFGVVIALLQTLAESAWADIERGMFGQAATKAARVIHEAPEVASSTAHAFNYWKAIGDACTVFSSAQSYANVVEVKILLFLLRDHGSVSDLDLLAEVDKVYLSDLETMIEESEPGSGASDVLMIAAILAYKRAIFVVADDRHAQAVSWYNLGWAEHQADVTLSPKIKDKLKRQSSRFSKAALRCFKHAIELEAGNSEFWNALGVVTMVMNVKVSQHAFVRSLHLNQNSAITWTNLGALYLVNDDRELANEAFTRAQSTAPDYAHAWLGQGLLANMYGEKPEAEGLFAHAFEISTSSSLLAKKQYVLSVFDALVTSSGSAAISREDVAGLLLPFFATQKLKSQAPNQSSSSMPYQHLLALYAERLNSFEGGIKTLASLNEYLEASFEIDESSETLYHYSCSLADLARSQLSTKSFSEAIRSADTALDLSGSLQEDEVNASLVNQIRRLRLSAHLTLGLSHFFLLKDDSSHITTSIEAFSTALQEADPDLSPDIVCALAQVLWAKGGEDAKTVARERLFDSVERYPEHVGSVCLLGAIAVLDDDQDALDAVHGDLESFRISDKIDHHDRARVASLLAAINDIYATDDSQRIATAASTTMIAPASAEGWSHLLHATPAKDDDARKFVAQMAKNTAMKAIPPMGDMTVDELAKVLGNTGSRRDALMSIMVDPASKAGWESLGAAIANA